MTIHPLRFVDRSRITTDWKCPRARFWNYEYQGRGIVNEATSLPLALGIAVHDSLATIATYHKDGLSVPIDEIAENAQKAVKQQILEASEGEIGADEFAWEQSCLVEGQIRGFYRYVWPRLLAEYPEIVAVEQEVEYKLSDELIFMAKPDLLLASDRGDLVYVEYKTTSSKTKEWINSWETAVQLHSSVKAVEQTLGRTPTHVQIVGLYKGYQSYGKQNSPFCYAYFRAGNPPFSEDTIAYEFRAGLKKRPVWELEGAVKSWVEGMPDEVLAEQFPLTPPILVNDRLVEAFFRQVVEREETIQEGIKEIQESLVALDTYFPQRFDQCQPSFGHGCGYKKLCHGYSKDPLDDGYVFREPHHEAELKQLMELEGG